MPEVIAKNPDLLTQNFQRRDLVICICNRLALQLREGQERLLQLTLKGRVGVGLGDGRGKGIPRVRNNVKKGMEVGRRRNYLGTRIRYMGNGGTC